MRVWAETYTDCGGIEMPRRLHFDDRVIDVVENIDQWYATTIAILKSKAALATCTFCAATRLKPKGI